jgi:hypothetical protein
MTLLVQYLLTTSIDGISSILLLQIVNLHDTMSLVMPLYFSLAKGVSR